MTFWTTSAKLWLCSLIFLSCGHVWADEKSKLAFWEGNWEGETTWTFEGKEPVTVKEHWHGETVLDGRTLLLRGMTRLPGGSVEFLWVYRDTKYGYRALYLDSTGAVSQHLGEWTDKTNVMDWKAVGSDHSTMQETFPEKDTLAVSIDMQTEDGSPLKIRGNLKKSDTAPKYLKPFTPATDSGYEMLAKFAGTWDEKLFVESPKNKPGERKGIEKKFAWTGTRILGGRILLQQGTNDEDESFVNVWRWLGKDNLYKRYDFEAEGHMVEQRGELLKGGTTLSFVDDTIPEAVFTTNYRWIHKTHFRTEANCLDPSTKREIFHAEGSGSRR